MASLWFLYPTRWLMFGGYGAYADALVASVSQLSADAREEDPHEQHQRHRERTPILRRQLRFTLPSSQIDPSFWDVLVQLKLEQLRLDERPVEIVGYMDLHHHKNNSDCCPIVRLSKRSFGHLSMEASSTSTAADAERLVVPGTLLVYNTIEAFKGANKLRLLEWAASQLWSSADSHHQVPATGYARFLLVVYTDIKSRRCVYWMGFPAVVAKPSAVINSGVNSATTVVKPSSSGSEQLEAAADIANATGVSDVYAPIVTSIVPVDAASSFSGAFVTLHPYVTLHPWSLNELQSISARWRPQPSLLRDELVYVALRRRPGQRATSPPPSSAVASAEVRDANYSVLRLAQLDEYLHYLRTATGAQADLESVVESCCLFCVRDCAAPASSGELSATDEAAAPILVGWPVRNVITGLATRYGLHKLRLLLLRPATASSVTSTPGDGTELSATDSGAMTSSVAVMTASSRSASGGAAAAAASWTSVVMEISLTRPPWLDLQKLSAGGGTTRTSASPTRDGGPAPAAAGRSSSPPQMVSPGSGGMVSAAALPPGLTAVGWEPNQSGVLAPRLAQLQPPPDNEALADQTSRLNLSLMRWRMLPELDVQALVALRVLFLGAGTLGCHLARDLLAWGVKHFTFVDCGRVAYSNPVRQPLFEFSDAAAPGGGKFKADAAAEALGRIRPGVQAAAVKLTIPMPDHPIAPGDEAAVEADVRTLTELMCAHDVTFLLTDTRESRWLPTVIGAAHGLTVFTVGLGFDSFLVMRHGVKTAAQLQRLQQQQGLQGTGRRGEGSDHVAAGKADAETPDSSATAAAPATQPLSCPSPPPHYHSSTGPRLGCYFCGDIVGPANSTTNRPLDQQCTVTRPGVAPLASAMAAELLVALLHHPLGPLAPSCDGQEEERDKAAEGEGEQRDTVAKRHRSTGGAPSGTAPTAAAAPEGRPLEVSRLSPASAGGSSTGSGGGWHDAITGITTTIRRIASSGGVASCSGGAGNNNGGVRGGASSSSERKTSSPPQQQQSQQQQQRPAVSPSSSAASLPRFETAASTGSTADVSQSRQRPLASAATAATAAPAGGLEEGATASPLGLVPHQIRFFLSSFTPFLATSPPNEQCTACSGAIVRAYREGGESLAMTEYSSHWHGHHILQWFVFHHSLPFLSSLHPS